VERAWRRVAHKDRATVVGTLWFKTLVAVLVVLSVLGVYYYRVSRIARQFDIRLEERVNERTRIARDLHDTLLQSFQGVLLRFKPSQPAPSGPFQQKLDSVIEQAAEAITEGRDAVQQLRSSKSTLASYHWRCARSERTCGRCGESWFRRLSGRGGRRAAQPPSNPPGRDLPGCWRDVVYAIPFYPVRLCVRNALRSASLQTR